MLRRLSLSCLLLLLALAAFAGTWQCTVLHTNDLHGMMRPFDYAGPADYAGKDLGGLARRATAIAQIRKDAANPIIVIDAGDVFTRGPWHTQWYGEPEIEALNLMSYDMLCIGNNEFKATEDVDSQPKMLALMRRSRFPWLTANLTAGTTGQPVEGIHPFIVRRYGEMRVGFLGLTAPRSATYPQTKGWTITDPIAVAKTWVPLARKECDVLIAVTHIGYDVDRQLAAEVSGIDAIVGGDSHTYLPQPVMVAGPDGRQVPIVQAGEQGIMLGRLDLTFSDEHGWRLIKADGKLIRIDKSIPEDPAVKELLERYLGVIQGLLTPSFDHWSRLPLAA